jgi:hypothetical protein
LRRMKLQAPWPSNLRLSNPRMPPWFVSMIHLLGNMIRLSNPLRV